MVQWCWVNTLVSSVTITDNNEKQNNKSKSPVVINPNLIWVTAESISDVYFLSFLSPTLTLWDPCMTTQTVIHVWHNDSEWNLQPTQICTLLGGTEAHFLKSRFYEDLWIYCEISFFFFHFLSCCIFLHSHIFQVFFPPFISNSSTLIHSPPRLFFSRLVSATLLLLFLLAWKILILSDRCPFAKTVTLCSSSNLESNCAKKSLRQLEPYMVLSLVLDAHNIRTLTAWFTLLVVCDGTCGYMKGVHAHFKVWITSFRWACSGEVRV